MNKVVQSIVFKGACADVYAGITAYALYPQFIAGVHNVAFIDPTDPGASCGLRYDLKVIRTLHYTLDMYHTELTSIEWQMRQSNLLSHNSGRWNLTPASETTTNATYELALGFKIFVPGRITRKLTETSLPLMFKGIQDLIDHHKQAHKST